MKRNGRPIEGSVGGMGRGGFSAVELMIVVLVIGLLMGILIPAGMQMKERAQETAMRQQMSSIKTALETYKRDHGAYPPSDVLDGRDHVMAEWEGGEILSQSLVGYFGDGDNPNQLPEMNEGEPDDGQVGPGMRTERGGQVYGPYMELEGLDLRYRWDGYPPDPNDPSAGGNGQKDEEAEWWPDGEERVFARVIMDVWGRPISYYVARGGMEEVWDVGDAANSRFNPEDNVVLSDFDEDGETDLNLQTLDENDDLSDGIQSNALRSAQYLLTSEGQSVGNGAEDLNDVIEAGP